MNLQQLFALEADGADTYVGEGLEYPWGGLYGGHIVAQALRAAAFTVSEEVLPHSLRAYFIRRGDNTQQVSYEVDRIRDGRSFGTRRVVARQGESAILNLEASFHRDEASTDFAPIKHLQNIARPEDIEETSWSSFLERRTLPHIAGAFARWSRTNCCVAASKRLARKRRTAQSMRTCVLVGRLANRECGQCNSRTSRSVGSRQTIQCKS